MRSSRKQKLARNTENNVPSDHSSGDGGLLIFFAPSNGQKAEPPDEKIAQSNEGCIDLISDDNGNDGADRTTDQQRRVTLPDEQQKQSLKNRRKKWRDTGSSTTMKTNERKSKKRKIILESDEEDDDNDYFPPTRRASNNHRVAASKSSSIADYINTRTNNQGKVSHYNHEMISSKYQNKRPQLDINNGASIIDKNIDIHQQTQTPIRNTRTNLLSKKAEFNSLLQNANESMRNIFQIQAFRNLQPKAIRGALKGKHQIIIMATGGGKSLCYQLPAVVLTGTALVISPLIALMVDQVEGLKRRGVSCALLSSVNKDSENQSVLKRLDGTWNNDTATAGISNDEIKLVYCTPEMIETAKFRAILYRLHRRGKLSLFAIDEAHCLSCWGHDFRPAFLKLGWLRDSFPEVPCMACTATATEKVIQDIRACLRFGDEVVCHKSSFNRKNIAYEVRYKDSLSITHKDGAIGDLLDTIKSQHLKSSSNDNDNDSPCAGIVYVHKRADAGNIAEQITRSTGIQAAAYHAGLKDSLRSETQQLWTRGDVQVVVATVAFGMGIDLAHVRYVIHWCLAKSVEGFYQESGRAGRDGLESMSILYYSKDDASKMSFIIRKNLEAKRQKQGKDFKPEDDQNLCALEGMVNYCTGASCRRKYLLKHFGEDIDASMCNKTCDYCRSPSRVKDAIEASEVAKHVSGTAFFRKFNNKKAKQSTWDGQWNGPAGDDDGMYESNSAYDNDDDVNGLSVFGGEYSKYEEESITYNDDDFKSGKKRRKQQRKSSGDILSKYEVSAISFNMCRYIFNYDHMLGFF